MVDSVLTNANRVSVIWHICGRLSLSIMHSSIIHCLWLGHETMVCVVCLFIFLQDNEEIYHASIITVNMNLLIIIQNKTVNAAFLHMQSVKHCPIYNAIKYNTAMAAKETKLNFEIKQTPSWGLLWVSLRVPYIFQNATSTVSYITTLYSIHKHVARWGQGLYLLVIYLYVHLYDNLFSFTIALSICMCFVDVYW